MARRMTDEEYKEVTGRIREVNSFVKDLDPAIREEAFKLLKPYMAAAGAASPGDSDGAPDGATEPTDVDGLLDTHASDKPADNGLLVAAILYSQFGNGPYAVKEFTDFADEHNLVMPKQFHKTFGPIVRNDAKVFRRGKDGWHITVQGAKWLEETFGVKQGSIPRDNAS